MTRKETGFLGRNISEEYKKGPFGPDGFRHPPPENRINYIIS